MTESEVLEMLARLQAAYREEVSPAEENLWVELFTDVEARAAGAATEARIRSGDPFMPKVGEILAAIRAASRPTGPEAWELVLKAVRHLGIYQRPAFSDPAVARAVELMGWERICNADADSPFPSKEFERIYDGVCQTRDRRALYDPALVSADLRAIGEGIGGEDA